MKMFIHQTVENYNNQATYDKQEKRVTIANDGHTGIPREG